MASANTQRETECFVLPLSLLRQLATADQRSKERLAHFFLERFSDSPESFALFLQHAETQIRHAKDRRLAGEYLVVLSPLAEHFGMFRLKRKLDTLCFGMVYPRESADVQRALQRYQRDSAMTLKRITRLLKATLLPGHAFTIIGRFKEPYSVYKKLLEKSYRDLVALHDLFGFRIILASNKPQECFDVLHALHDRFVPVAGRFKDYVSIPKINGYQSLHTTLHGVLPDLDVPIEVQIRTQFMHDFSQTGLSSHWLYKKKGGPMLTPEQRTLLQHVSSLSQFAGRQQHTYCMLGNSLLQLPRNATLADAMAAARLPASARLTVNGKNQFRAHQLADGDLLDVLHDKALSVTVSQQTQ